jgi:hypothetical protein
VTHKFAKFLILAVGALGLSALPALAGTCAGGDNVTSGFTCSLGSLSFDFTNVAFSPTGGTQSLTLTDQTGIYGDNYVLDFDASVGSAGDLGIDYTVTSTSDNLTTVDNEYSPTGAPLQSLDETVCTVGTNPTPSCGTVLQTLDNETGNEEYSESFGPESSVYIEKDFNVPTSQFNDSIIATPEPTSLGLMLIGALGIGLASRKFRKA